MLLRQNESVSESVRLEYSSHENISCEKFSTTRKTDQKTTSEHKLLGGLRLGLSLYQQLERPLKYTK